MTALPPICQAPGCAAEANIYTIYGYDPEPTFTYCDTHAYEAGFCTSCGGFYGGTESFFMSDCPRMCFECCEELKSDLGEGVDDDYDNYDDEEDLP